MSNNIVAIGTSVTIGSAIIKRLLQLYPNAKICAFSRTKVTDCIKNVVYEQIDYIDEAIIQRVANFVYDKSGAVNLVFVATGIIFCSYWDNYIHTQDIMPEESLERAICR